MQTHTTKEKQKPVIHRTTLIGISMIRVLNPEVIGMRLGDMLKSVIRQLMPTDQPAMRAQLCLFIDPGYLEIAKVQNNQVTNLIQIIEEMNVKFL